MLRVATWYEARLGRNDGNPLYVQACLKRMQYYGSGLVGPAVNKDLETWFTTPELDPRADSAARELFAAYGEALEVDHFYPTGDITPYGHYDLNIWTDWGEDGLTGFLPYTPIDCPKPMAYWCSDSHIHEASYSYRLSMARKADYVFVAQKRAVEEMKRDGIENPIWLPHAVEPLAYPKFDLLTKKYDVSFVGHVNSGNRVEALDRIFREFPNFYYGQALFEAAARKYAESKICFNISMTDDINMRTFEVMATGSFLLTSWNPTIEELFKDGEHLVLYRNEEEMVQKARYYLEHDAEREAIAQAGYEEVIKNHTIQTRVSRILQEHLKNKEKLHASLSVS